MPYIDPARRIALTVEKPQNAGELNYVITMKLIQYLKDKGESYQTYNDIMGALEGSKQEIYRRKIAPYEDEKIKENSDVF